MIQPTSIQWIGNIVHVYSPPLGAWLYAENRPPIIWMGKNHYGWVEIWVDGWWTGKTHGAKKKSSKTIDIISYALEVSANGVTCVFLVHFRSSYTF